MEEEIQCIDEYNEKVYGVLARLNKALGLTSTPPPTTVVETEPHPLAEHPTPTVGTDRPVTKLRTIPPRACLPTMPTTDRVKLPKIILPHFMVT